MRLLLNAVETWGLRQALALGLGLAWPFLWLWHRWNLRISEQMLLEFCHYIRPQLEGSVPYRMAQQQLSEFVSVSAFMDARPFALNDRRLVGRARRIHNLSRTLLLLAGSGRALEVIVPVCDKGLSGLSDEEILKLCISASRRE